jgi:hypothetical protein
MNASLRYYAAWKKLDIKIYILYDINLYKILEQTELIYGKKLEQLLPVPMGDWEMAWRSFLGL